MENEEYYNIGKTLTNLGFVGRTDFFGRLYFSCEKRYDCDDLVEYRGDCWVYTEKEDGDVTYGNDGIKFAEPTHIDVHKFDTVEELLELLKRIRPAFLKKNRQRYDRRRVKRGLPQSCGRKQENRQKETEMG